MFGAQRPVICPPASGQCGHQPAQDERGHQPSQDRCFHPVTAAAQRIAVRPQPPPRPPHPHPPQSSQHLHPRCAPPAPCHTATGRPRAHPPAQPGPSSPRAAKHGCRLGNALAPGAGVPGFARPPGQNRLRRWPSAPDAGLALHRPSGRCSHRRSARSTRHGDARVLGPSGGRGRAESGPSQPTPANDNAGQMACCGTGRRSALVLHKNWSYVCCNLTCCLGRGALRRALAAGAPAMRHLSQAVPLSVATARITDRSGRPKPATSRHHQGVITPAGHDLGPGLTQPMTSPDAELSRRHWCACSGSTWAVQKLPPRPWVLRRAAPPRSHRQAGRSGCSLSQRSRINIRIRMPVRTAEP
jgi:hypothetical protein